MEYSLNTIGLYPDLSLEETVKASLAHGYRTFEMWLVSKEEIAEIARLEKEYGVRFSTIVVRHNILNVPEERENYLTALEELMQDMQCISTRTIITTVGQDSGAPRPEQHASIVAGLKAAAPLCEKYGITLMVEPLNTVKNHIGYYLDSSAEGFEIIREVNSPYIKLLFDIYHQLQMGEDVLPIIQENLELISHFHVAAIPERDEKLWDVVDYAPILAFIRDSGTKAPVGIELFPTEEGGSDKVLEELKRFL